MEANNAAAMREAVLAIRKAMMLDSGNGPTTEFHNVVDALTQAALAAPPRNCDVYPSVAEARNAFICEQCEHPCGDCTVCDDDYALCHPCGIKWLFALAKKGKTDGSK